MTERLVRWGLVGCGDIAEKRVAAALRESRGSALLAVARARAPRPASPAAPARPRPRQSGRRRCRSGSLRVGPVLVSESKHDCTSRRRACVARLA